MQRNPLNDKVKRILQMIRNYKINDWEKTKAEMLEAVAKEIPELKIELYYDELTDRVMYKLINSDEVRKLYKDWVR